MALRSVAILVAACALILAASPAETPVYRYVVVDMGDGHVVAERAYGPASELRLLDRIPPGSTLKPLLLSVAIAGGLDPTHVVPCEASSLAKPAEERCWLAAGHDAVDLVRGVANSCSVYVRYACPFVDADRYRKLLIDLGFTGLPAPADFRGLGCERWMGGSPGIAATPLELANAYRLAFASDGGGPAIPGRDVIRRGLREACLTGTAGRIRDRAPLRQIIGKTGTSATSDGRRIGIFVGIDETEKPGRVIVVAGLDIESAEAASLAGRQLDALAAAQEP